MRSVAITDGGAAGIWFFTVFVALAVLGFLVIVFKGVLPAMREQVSDSARGVVLKIALVWVMGLAGCAFGYYVLWNDLSEIRIGDDGGWSLLNAVGGELGFIPGDAERTAEFAWLEADVLTEHETGVPHRPGELTIETADGFLFEIYIDDGAPAVLERLGYAAGGPCADKKAEHAFTTHTYTKRGPWCPQPERARPTPPAGEPVFALWSKDGWWYPARAGRADGDRSEVVYSDGSKEWRKAKAEVGPRALPSVAHLQADWGGKGKYFPCVVERTGDLGAGRYTVEYADGTKEEVSDERLRFQLPRKDDLLFALSGKDGWWYPSTVVGSGIQGLLVRPAGHGSDESKTWEEVLPLQLAPGVKVEVSGKPAVVVAHAGLNAKVRFTGGGAESMVSVRDLRFRPFKS